MNSQSKIQNPESKIQDPESKIPRALHLLPHRTAGAAENMAVDFLLLQRYPAPQAARFRHYDWRVPAVTFGYSQKWAFVLSRYEPDRDFCRRPSGGGIVDHADDWTYTLVVPGGHSLHREPAPVAYYLIHRALADTLMSEGQDVVLESEQPDAQAPVAGLCFQQAEPHDVIHRTTGAKVAGAALKRNKNGLLVQGSISRSPLPELDWSRFAETFPTHLAHCLEIEAEERPWPDLDPDEEAHLTDQFSSPEWNERR